MTFATPLFLIAALAGIIPVILHLISSRKAPELSFSTLRFLRVSVQRTRRRKRLHDLLLLLLRVAALVLVAVGLSRPAIQRLGVLWSGSAARAVAIVFDNSSSMALTDNGQPRFETAARAAERILGELQEGDPVALLFTGGPEYPKHGKLLHSQEAVREMLLQSRPSFERADLPAKIIEARALLATAETPNKELYVITDGQALSWSTLSDNPAETNADTPGADIPIILVDVHRQVAPNLALRQVAIEAPVRAVGVPATATVDVFNASALPQQPRLELFLDGNRVASSPDLNVPPLASLKYSFQFALQSAGVHRGEVRLASEDASMLDNRLVFAMVIDPQIPVLIVKPKRNAIPYLDDSFYLEQALAAGDSEQWAIRASTITADELESEPLSGYTTVFCVNLAPLTPPALDRLRDYVSGGGCLVWTCGEKVRPDLYNQMNQEAGGALIPAPLASSVNSQPDDNHDRRIAWIDSEHPALADLAEPASLYQSVLVQKHVSFELPLPAEVRVLARLDDGQPLLIEHRIGSGKTIMLATSVHVAWTNLPLRPVFLPLLVKLTFYLAGAQGDQPQVFAGSPIWIPVDSKTLPTHLDVALPFGDVIRVPVESAEGKAVQISTTHDVGIYVVRPFGQVPGREQVFAVNPDPDESDPAGIAPEALKMRFGSRQLVVCDEPASVSSTIQSLRKGESLWELFMAAVLVALVLESYLANRKTSQLSKPAAF